MMFFGFNGLNLEKPEAPDGDEMVSNCTAKFSRNLALGAALVAGLALPATKKADAQQADANAHTTAGSEFSLLAPFTTQFETGPGQFVSFIIERDGMFGDNMRLYAFHYDSDGDFAGATDSGGASLAPDHRVRILSSGATTVSFAYLFDGTVRGTADTLDGSVKSRIF